MLRTLILDLLTPLKRWSWNRLLVGEQAGIRIVDASGKRESSEDFLRHTVDALALVQRVDSRRFKRVVEHIRYIVQQELHFGVGKYDRRLAACIVDLARLKFSDYPAGAIHVYAALLVHEATHSVICRLGIPYTPATRHRVEHLCHIEEARFLGRISRQLGDEWMERAYKLDGYEQEWRATWCQRLKAVWKRRGETNEDAISTTKG